MKKGENGCVKYCGGGGGGGSRLCIFRGRGEETPHTFDLLPHAFLPFYILTCIHCYEVVFFFKINPQKGAAKKQHLFNFAAFASVGGELVQLVFQQVHFFHCKSSNICLSQPCKLHFLMENKDFLYVCRCDGTLHYVAAHICNTCAPPVQPKYSSAAAYAWLAACCYIPFQWQVTLGS